MTKVISIVFCAHAAGLFAQAPRSGAIGFVPIDMYNKLPYVQVHVAGSPRPLVFLLNPSSVPTYIDKACVARLGLTPHTETDSTRSESREYVSAPAMTLGGAVLPVSRLRVADLAPDFPAAGRAFDGILGADLFRHFAVEVDNEVGLLRLFEPDEFHYDGAGQALPLDIVGGRPYVRATLRVRGAPALAHEYRLDFGTGDALNDDAFKLLRRPADDLPDLGRAELLQIGDVRLTGVNGAAGGPLLGEELLRRFNITFDYAHQRVFFEVSRHLHDAFVFDMSGLSYTLTPDFTAIAIDRVARGTPGDEAGLRAGDVITRIDSTAVEELGLDRVLRLFEEPHVHNLTVRRGAAVVHVRIRLRKLL